MFAENYAKYYELFNADKPYEDEIDLVYRMAESPNSILDIGCGPAHYWKYFPQNTRITGIELSKHMALKSVKVVCCDITEYRTKKIYDVATALFDVVNYIPRHDWWSKIPVRKGGFFIFDIWDVNKVERDGFQKTIKRVNGATRKITPVFWDGKKVELKIEVKHGQFKFDEKHTMYLYSQRDIERFCGNDFEITEIRSTPRWQTWYKCKKK